MKKTVKGTTAPRKSVNVHFISLCKKHGVNATYRQEKKWLNNKGLLVHRIARRTHFGGNNYGLFSPLPTANFFEIYF